MCKNYYRILEIYKIETSPESAGFWLCTRQIYKIKFRRKIEKSKGLQIDKDKITVPNDKEVY